MSAPAFSFPKGALMRPVLAVSAVALLAACTSVITPKLSENTGTTLAQRCVDYRATVAAYEAVGELDNPAYVLAKGFVVANCPLPPPDALLERAPAA